MADGGSRFPANSTRLATGTGGAENIVKFGKMISSGLVRLEFDLESPAQDNVIELHLLDSISSKRIGFSFGYDAAGFLVGKGFDGSFWNAISPETSSLHVEAVFDLDTKSVSLSWSDKSDPADPSKSGSAAKAYTGQFKPESLRLFRNMAYPNNPSEFDNVVVAIPESSEAKAGQSTAEVVFSDSFEGPVQRPFSYLDDEDMYAVFGRSVLWAAKREPDSGLTVKVDRGVLPADVPGKASRNSKVDVAIYDVAAVLCHELEYEAEVRPGQDLQLPHLKAGPHWARVTLRKGKNIADWTTCYVNITAPVAVESIAFEPELIHQGGRISAKIRLSGTELDKYVLSYRLVDTWDRVIGRGQAPTGRCAFREVRRLRVLRGRR